mgnify:CR=1 FL=1
MQEVCVDTMDVHRYIIDLIQQDETEHAWEGPTGDAALRTKDTKLSTHETTIT